MFYDPQSQQKVKEALAWAYRSGYYMAEEAAQEFATVHGLTLRKVSLGQYGDTLEFVDLNDESYGDPEAMDGDHVTALESVYGPNE